MNWSSFIAAAAREHGFVLIDSPKERGDEFVIWFRFEDDASSTRRTMALRRLDLIHADLDHFAKCIIDELSQRADEHKAERGRATRRARELDSRWSYYPWSPCA